METPTGNPDNITKLINLFNSSTQVERVKMYEAIKLTAYITTERLIEILQPDIVESLEVLRTLPPDVQSAHFPQDWIKRGKRKLRTDGASKIVAIAKYIQENPSHKLPQIAEGLGFPIGTVKRYSRSAKNILAIVEEENK